MIKNSRLLEQFENNYLRSETPDYSRNLRFYEAMYEEARALGIFPLKDPLERLEEKISLAKAMNVSGTP